MNPVGVTYFSIGTSVHKICQTTSIFKYLPYIILPISEIVYLEANGHYSYIRKNGTNIHEHDTKKRTEVEIRESIGYLHRALAGKYFVQIDKSTVINTAYISSFSEKSGKCVLTFAGCAHEIYHEMAIHPPKNTSGREHLTKLKFQIQTPPMQTVELKVSQSFKEQGCCAEIRRLLEEP